MNALFEAAKEVCDFMQVRRWAFCVIGGLAVQRWGEPRLTQDADLTLLTGFENEEIYVDTLLAEFAPRREDAREFSLINRVLLLRANNGVPIDISLAALPYEEEVVAHATPFAFAKGIVLPTCSADDLFIMKAFAARLSEAVYRPEILTVARLVLEGKPWRK